MRWWSQIFCCFLSHLSCHLVVLFRINGVVYCQDDPTRCRDKCNKTAVNCQPLFIDIYGALYFFIHLCVLRANIETKFGKGNDDGEEERRRRSRKRLNWVSTSKSLFPFQYKNRFSVVDLSKRKLLVIRFPYWINPLHSSWIMWSFWRNLF